MIKQQLQWVDDVNRLAMSLTPSQQKWVTYSGSLTGLLRTIESPAVSFSLLGMEESPSTKTLLEPLPQPMANLAFHCRKITWSRCQSPWIYAESWFTPSLYDVHPEILSSELPLGYWLFNNPLLQRTSFQFARIIAVDDCRTVFRNAHDCSQASSLLARRRWHTLQDNQAVMVIEVFHPPCLDHFSRFMPKTPIEELQ